MLAPIACNEYNRQLSALPCPAQVVAQKSSLHAQQACALSKTNLHDRNKERTALLGTHSGTEEPLAHSASILNKQVSPPVCCIQACVCSSILASIMLRWLAYDSISCPLYDPSAPTIICCMHKLHLSTTLKAASLLFHPLQIAHQNKALP